MEAVLNSEWKVTVPEGFRVMDDAERGALNTIGAAPQWGARDPDRHMVISAAWKKSGFASLLLSSQEVAKKMEAAVRGPMQAYGYRLEGFLSEDAGGVKADGYRYTYTADDIGMTGESYSIKKGKNFYYLHTYYRTELAAESAAAVKELIGSSEWV